MVPATDTVGFEVAAILRQYLAVDARNAAIDWPGTSDHLGRIGQLIGCLEQDALPAHGDPLVAIELESRALQPKLRALDEIEASEITSREAALGLAEHFRRWPSLECDVETRQRLRAAVFETSGPLTRSLSTRPPVALDGVRAVLRHELSFRELTERSEVPDPGTECSILRRAIDRLDAVCPDPMVEIGHGLARLGPAGRADPAGAGRALPPEPSDPAFDLEQRADTLQATSLEGAMVHLLLAVKLGESGMAEKARSRIRLHLARACRVLEAHTGIRLEEIGGAPAMPRASDPLLARPQPELVRPARRATE